jgi:hypothetical protein
MAPLRYPVGMWWVVMAAAAPVVVGTAAESKAGALVLADDGVTLWVGGLERWPAGVVGTRVEVAGERVERAVAPEATRSASGEISQGVAPGSAPAPVIELASWRALPATPEGPWRVEVSDGSANFTEFVGTGTSATWVYTPVTPATSSSGTYSGGPAARGAVDAAVIEALWTWINAVSVEPRVHSARRELGTAVVSITTAGGTRSMVLTREAVTGLPAMK